MPRRTTYRKEVDSQTLMPADGDHYAFAVHPPLKSDDVYCRIYCEGRSWGGSARPVESRDAAIEYIRNRLETLEEKATDDKERGSIPRYPEPPKPANTRYVVHPDFDGEIGPREIWGDTTLNAFGVEPDSRYAENPWYQTREAYQEWLAPLLENATQRVCRVYGQGMTEIAFWWLMADETGTLHLVRYRTDSGRLSKTTSSWTSGTRRVGGIGSVHAPPADVRHLSVGQTPFASGLDEDSISEWVEENGVPSLDKSDLNQVDSGEIPSRYTGRGESTTQA